MSYELCLMSYLMSYVILSSYDHMALVYVLLVGLRLNTISRFLVLSLFGSLSFWGGGIQTKCQNSDKFKVSVLFGIKIILVIFCLNPTGSRLQLRQLPYRPSKKRKLDFFGVIE